MMWYLLFFLAAFIREQIQIWIVNVSFEIKYYNALAELQDSWHFTYIVTFISISFKKFVVISFIWLQIMIKHANNIIFYNIHQKDNSHHTLYYYKIFELVITSNMLTYIYIRYFLPYLASATFRCSVSPS